MKSPHLKTKVNCRTIFRAWLPLTATWLLMALELPFVQGIVARSQRPEVNLAALGVAFSLILIFESPVFLLTSASTALVEDQSSYRKLRNFTLALAAFLTLILGILLLPSLFSFLAVKILGLRADIALAAHQAALLLLPVPTFVAYRRFNQGILIRHNLAGRVAAGALIRLAAMALPAIILYWWCRPAGATLGAVALSSGMIMEGLASRLMVNSSISNLHKKPPLIHSPLTYTSTSKFYFPLALVGVITTAAQPLITFFLARAPHPVESLAVLPVINSTTFFFTAFSLSLQEIIIAHLGDKHEGYRALRRFAGRLGILLFAVLILLLCTPLAKPWFVHLYGLTLELTYFALTPAFFTPLLPLLSLLTIWQRAVLIRSKHTFSVTTASLAELTTIALVMFGAAYLEIFSSGATAAVTASITGRAMAVLVLLRDYSQVRKAFNLTDNSRGAPTAS